MLPDKTVSFRKELGAVRKVSMWVQNNSKSGLVGIIYSELKELQGSVIIGEVQS